MTKIYTSSWFHPLPETIQKIGISRGTPRGYPAGYRKMPELMPGSWFKSVSPEEYHRRFMAQLAALDPAEIVAKIEALSPGKEGAALLCYEAPGKPADWCHRGQVAAWLHEKAGVEVFEFGHEHQGCGWAHPKLYKPLRRGGLL